MISRLLDKARGARLGWQLGRESITRDALTGLNSRNFFERFGRHEIERRSKKNVIAVITFDINNFKPINDLLGHAVGDKLLRIFGQCVMACLRRSSDAAYRFGGDEVVVFLDGATEEAANRFGLKVRAMFLALSSNSCSPLPEGFGLSFGTEIMTRKDVLQAVLERSDARMYADKTQLAS